MLHGCPKILQEFFQIVFSRFPMTKAQRQYSKAAVCAILLHIKVTEHRIGETLEGFQRNKSSVSKMFRNQRYSTDELAWTSAMVLVEKTYKKVKKSKRLKRKPWILVIDTTHRRRFGKLFKRCC